MTNTKRFLRFILFSTLTASILFISSVVVYRVLAKHSGDNPHELENGVSNIECTNCHRQAPGRIPERPTRVVLPNPDDFSMGHVAMCVSCHEGSEGSHPIGVIPNYPVPADLPLDMNNGVSCLTCHYTHGSLKSDHPCCSVSFLDRMFDRERMRKSFLLRRENCHGELCKACHEKY